MHGYCSTCINILVFFFLSLFLFGALNSLSLSPHSPWSTSRLPHEEIHRSTSHHCRRSTSHHYRRSASNHTPPITLPSISVFLIWSRSNHCSRWTRWSRSNHYCRSTSNHCHMPPITLPSISIFPFYQDQTIVVDELVDQDQSITADQHQTIATQSLIKSPPVNSLISRCLISGFRVGWVMIWLSNWVGFGLNEFLIS